MGRRSLYKLNWLLAVAAIVLGLPVAQPAVGALVDSPADSVSVNGPHCVIAFGNPAAGNVAINELLADIIAEAKAELAAASNTMGLGISFDESESGRPTQPSPQRDGRLPDVLLPGSGNSTSCGGTAVSGSSSSGSAQPAAAFFSAVTLADSSPRGHLPREASLQFSSNSLRPPTPPPRS